MQAYGEIDVLVNNAGVGVYKSFMDATMADWDRALNVNLKGQVLCSREAVPQMQKQGKGAIVNISSVHAFQTVNGVAPYATSKGGVYALTHAMAIDLAPTIRVNAIAPGWVYTPLIQSIFDSYADPAAQRKEVERRALMKRIGIARGDRLCGGFPGQRRGEFHHRHPAVCGRRPDSPTWRAGRRSADTVGSHRRVSSHPYDPMEQDKDHMTTNKSPHDITLDDLTAFAGKGPALVTFGETLVRDTPSDLQRLERTAAVNISLAGSEYTLAMMLARLGNPVCVHHPSPGQSVRMARA